MTIGNFTAVFGSSSNDDFLLANNGEIIYGLQGNDNLGLDPSLTENNAAILVGGSGGDRYTLNANKFAVIFDNSSSEDDSLIVDGIGINNLNSYFLDIDNRHLYAFNTDNQQYVLLLDWQNSENQIETFELDNGQQLSYQNLVTELDNFRSIPNSNYLGNFTFEQLNDTAQNTSGFPLSEALIDFASFGLSPETIDDDLQEIANTAKELENSDDDVEVYRFLNRDTGAHFYTASEVERENILDNLPNYKNEGIAFEGVPLNEKDALTGVTPVYRLLNRDTGVHLYTIFDRERNSVLNNLPNYNDEDIAYYAYETSQPGTIPLYRYLNTDTGAHFYTASANEKASVDTNLPNLVPEGNEDGIGYWVLPSTVDSM
ncbi:hypothetical protein [Myxosarcina sp. GI1]|uniref:hypothetical protein n=1 Tax=Myxosarcina sp. GI1 TaxID=1541065 RepID=UPI00055B0508|nr:hypothetical protein [Myxosarcina sp. GI1]